MQTLTDDEARRVISANLERLRGERTLSDVARACQTSPGAIQAIERGQRAPGASMLTRLAATFNVSIDELLTPPPKKSKKTA